MTTAPHPVLEVILDAIKLARELYNSGVVQAGKAVLDSLIDGLENEFTPEALEARVKALHDTLAADRAGADEKLRRKFDTSEDETMPGVDPSGTSEES